MKKLFALMLAVAVSFVAFAQQPQHKCNHSCCNNQSACQQSSTCAKEAKCDKAPERTYEILSVAEFAQRIASKKVVVMDVRTEKEFSQGHIKGARNVVWNDKFEDNLKASGIKPNKTVAVYCRSGRRSKLAAEALVKLGYKVVELDTGILGWQQAGKEVVK